MACLGCERFNWQPGSTGAAFPPAGLTPNALKFSEIKVFFCKANKFEGNQRIFICSDSTDCLIFVGQVYPALGGLGFESGYA